MLASSYNTCGAFSIYDTGSTYVSLEYHFEKRNVASYMRLYSHFDKAIILVEEVYSGRVRADIMILQLKTERVSPRNKN